MRVESKEEHAFDVITPQRKHHFKDEKHGSAVWVEKIREGMESSKSGIDSYTSVSVSPPPPLIAFFSFASSVVLVLPDGIAFPILGERRRRSRRAMEDDATEVSIGRQFGIIDGLFGRGGE